MDFWGELPSGEYLLVIIDEYFGYPEVEFVRSTSAQAVIPHLDRVFYTHGFPKTAKTAGGPPLKGHDYHQYMQWAGKRSVVVSPEDPEANGLAEEFHENNEHIAHIEGNIPIWKERTISKSSTNFSDTIEPHHTAPREKHPPKSYLIANSKSDSRKKTKQHKIRSYPNETSKPKLSRKPTRMLRPIPNHTTRSSPPNPETIQIKPTIYSKPCKVTNIQGTQITAARGAKIRKRDAQRFKVITNPVHRRYGESRYPLDQYKEDTSTFDWAPTIETTPEPPNQPINPMPPHQYPIGHSDPNINLDLQRNQRQRRPPNRYNPQKGR